MNVLIQGSAIGGAFAAHGGLEVAAGFRTVGTMIGYLQSRRRHLVGLSMLPTARRGSQAVVPLDPLNVFLPLTEYSAVQMMGDGGAVRKDGKAGSRATRHCRGSAG